MALHKRVIAERSKAWTNSRRGHRRSEDISWERDSGRDEVGEGHNAAGQLCSPEANECRGLSAGNALRTIELEDTLKRIVQVLLVAVPVAAAVGSDLVLDFRGLAGAQRDGLRVSGQGEAASQQRGCQGKERQRECSAMGTHLGRGQRSSTFMLPFALPGRTHLRRRSQCHRGELRVLEGKTQDRGREAVHEEERGDVRSGKEGEVRAASASRDECRACSSRQSVHRRCPTRAIRRRAIGRAPPEGPSTRQKCKYCGRTAQIWNNAIQLTRSRK